MKYFWLPHPLSFDGRQASEGRAVNLWRRALPVYTRFLHFIPDRKKLSGPPVEMTSEQYNNRGVSGLKVEQSSEKRRFFENAGNGVMGICDSVCWPETPFSSTDTPVRLSPPAPRLLRAGAMRERSDRMESKHLINSTDTALQLHYLLRYQLCTRLR